MTLADVGLTKTAVGRARPRIAPPLPARSDLAGFRTTCSAIGFDPMPWQETAARYAEALGPDGRHMYREVAWIVSRQNGKTSPLVPLIVKRLRAGRKMMHTAQDRSLPRLVHEEVADTLVEHFAAELAPNRHGRYATRFSSGQEEIKMRNGGRYRIVAPTRGGARGPSNDDVLIDELREMDTWDFIAAAKPTMTVSRDPQIVYLSNAGDESSVVLNALRARAESDPSLAYLEWSADPSRATDDVVGWAEANPAMGHERPEMGSVYETLVSEHRTALLEGTMPVFETEHLCRSVTTLRSRLVDPAAWRD
jgi:phage terminase large subunit-like protein